VPAALLAHDREGGARHIEYAEEVGFELRAEIGVIDIFDRRDVAVARVVDNDIEMAERIDCMLNGGFRGLWIGDVERHGSHAFAVSFDQLRQVFDPASGGRPQARLRSTRGRGRVNCR
jgi:hypothetical protein